MTRSSGIKRGLAFTAVSALAVTGLPFLATSASAVPLSGSVATGTVELDSQSTGFASIRNDGENTTVRLLARGGTDVQQVRFEYVPSSDPSATPTVIATVSRTNGAFSAEWAPPAALYNTDVNISAVGLNSVGAEIGGTNGTDVADDVTVSAGANAVNISNAAGSEIGVFDNGSGASYGAISGTTSDVTTNPAITVSSPDAGAAAVATDEDQVGTPAGGTRTFSAPVDFTGYTWATGANPVDEAVVVVEGGSDEAEAVRLYKATLTNVTATASPASVPVGGSSVVTVKAVDQKGNPVVGARVFRTGGATPQLTNSAGEAKFTVSGVPAAGTTAEFFVDQNDNDAFDAATEFQRSVTISSFAPVASTIVATSKDGAAFDLNERDADDVVATVKDQNGGALTGQVVRYTRTVTPFDGSDPVTQTLTASAGTEAGTYVLDPGTTPGTVEFATWVERDGTPGQTAGDLSAANLTVKVGQAEVKFDAGTTAQVQAGTTQVFGAKLVLEDGTPLPGRNVAISWAPTGDAVVAQQADQPAGTTRTGNNGATATTKADGSVSVAIADPAAASPSTEAGGTLTIATANTDGIGNANDTSSLNVDFLANAAVDQAQTTTSATELAGDATPGRPVAVQILVKNAAGNTLSGRSVEMSVDSGFFTTPDATNLSELKPEPAAAQDAQYGEWEDRGKTYTTSTNAGGVARGVIALEREAGLDDDGLHTVNVSFKVDGKTFTRPVTFSSGTPLNGGEVRIELADVQAVKVLPKAPTAEKVAYNVRATDQWGNLVAASVAVEDDSSAARVVAPVVGGGFTPATSVTSNFTDNGPNLYAEASAATSQVVTGSWTAPRNRWTDAQTGVDGFQEESVAGADGVASDTVVLTDDADAIEWYVVDFAQATFNLAASGDSTVPVGTAVTTTLEAKDQEGQPLEGLGVEFIRSGPGSLQDGDPNNTRGTNVEGKATYTFAGTQAGSATVNAIVYEGFNSSTGRATGDILGNASVTKTFANPVTPPPARKGINVKIGPKRNFANGDDRIAVRAPRIASGAVAVVQFRTKAGKWRVVRTARLNANGNRVFRIKDAKPRQVRVFRVVVRATPTTKRAVTSAVRIR